MPNTGVSHLKIESLVHDHKYRGAPKDGHLGKEETIVMNLKYDIAATNAGRYSDEQVRC